MFCSPHGPCIMYKHFSITCLARYFWTYESINVLIRFRLISDFNRSRIWACGRPHFLNSIVQTSAWNVVTINLNILLLGCNVMQIMLLR